MVKPAGHESFAGGKGASTPLMRRAGALSDAVAQMEIVEVANSGAASAAGGYACQGLTLVKCTRRGG